MSNIVISMTSEQLATALDSLTILFFVISAFFLCWIKKRVSENLSKTFVYFIIAVLGIILVKVLVIFADLQIINSFVYDSLIAIPAFFFLLGVIIFYKSIAKVVRPKTSRVHHRIHHRSVRRRR
jgi:amino acid permease